MVQRRLFALLVSDGGESFESLKALLKSQGIAVWSCRTLTEAARLVDETHPELVFTAAQHADGTWRDVVIMAEKATEATNVIVVGKSNDVRLYLAAMDSGAFDFILPPFEPEPIGHIIRVAAEAVRRRREAEALKALA
jgi:DNA-binding NtrC family response regulator